MVRCVLITVGGVHLLRELVHVDGGLDRWNRSGIVKEQGLFPMGTRQGYDGA